MEPIIPFIRSYAKSQKEYTGPWSLMHSMMWAAKWILGVNLFLPYKCSKFSHKSCMIWSIIGKSDAGIIHLQINVQAWDKLVPTCANSYNHAKVKYL